MRIDRRAIWGFCIATTINVFGYATHADETCNSPYMSGLIKGQEEYIHVRTLGVEGLGDGSDKLVTIDVESRSPRPMARSSTACRSADAVSLITWDSRTIASTCGPAASMTV